MTHNKVKELYEVESTHGAFYSGGDIQWTRDGGQLLCLCEGEVRVFDMGSGRVSVCGGDQGQEDPVITFCLSEDGDTVISAHKSGLFKSWRWREDSPVPKQWKSIHKGPVARVTLSTCGTVLVSGGSDSSVRVWDLPHNSCLHNLTGLQGVVSVLRVVGGQVLGAADDLVIHSWDVRSGAALRQFSGHLSRVTALDVHDTQEYLVSCGRDKVVMLWQLRTGKLLRTLPVYESLESLVLLPTAPSLPGSQPDEESLLVAVAGEKGIVTVWDVTHNRLVFSQTNSLVRASADGGLAVTHLLYCETLKTLAVVSADHNIILHHAVTFTITKQLVGFSDQILDLAYLAGEKLIAVASNSCDIKVYRSKDMACQLLQGHSDMVVTLASCTANPSLLLSGSKDKSVRVWHVTEDSAACVALALRHTASVTSVTLPSSSCHFLLSAALDSTIKLWKLPSSLPPGSCTSLNVHMTTLAHEKDINSVCVSPNDKFIATGSLDKTAKVWNSEDLSLVGVLRGHRRGVWHVCFSPVDQVLLTTSADSTIKLWALETLTCIKTLEGHGSSVVVGRFVCRGLQLVSAGADGLLKLWTTRTGECVKTFEHHDAKIWALIVSGDEERLVTGGEDSQLVTWRDVTAQSQAERLAELQQRTLKDQELSNLLHRGDLLPALELALTLERPATVLTIVEKVLRKDRDGLLRTVRRLNADQKSVLLRLATEWNSISKHCYAAQMVVSCLLDELAVGSLPVDRATLEAFLPYTDRHLRRSSQLLQDLHLLQFTANIMKPHT